VANELEEVGKKILLSTDPEELFSMRYRFMAEEELVKRRKGHLEELLVSNAGRHLCERRIGELELERVKIINRHSSCASLAQLEIAKANGISRRTYLRWQERAAIPEAQFVEKLREQYNKAEPLTGKDLDKLARELRKADRIEEEKRTEHQVEWGIYNISVAEASSIADMCNVDAIVTDPPYPRDDLDVYAELGEYAMTALKPGGWCAVMVGQQYMPHIMQVMIEAGLIWRWQICLHYAGGGHARINEMAVFQNWKPVLMFQKGPASPLPRWHGDYIKEVPSEQNKSLHKWQQGASAFKKLCWLVASKGDCIADPFLGAGTTGVAALQMGMNFVGSDIDAEACGIAEKRIARVGNLPTP